MFVGSASLRRSSLARSSHLSRYGALTSLTFHPRAQRLPLPPPFSLVNYPDVTDAVVCATAGCVTPMRNQESAPPAARRNMTPERRENKCSEQDSPPSGQFGAKVSSGIASVCLIRYREFRPLVKNQKVLGATVQCRYSAVLTSRQSWHPYPVIEVCDAHM